MIQGSEKILIVDDEPNFISQFDTFLKAKGFRVVTAYSAQEAEICLKENSIAVIVADQRMPGTKGVDLLSQVHKESPDIIRVLITGYSDLDAVADAINKGAIYRYISKSSFPEEIAAVVSQCVEKYRQDCEVKRLTLANKRLLRMLAAEESLSACGIFGREVSKKIEEMVLGLSGYLFSETGRDDPENLKKKFNYLESALSRIRSFSSLLDSKEQKVSNANINLLIAEERGRLLQAAKAQGVKTEIICDLDSRLPDISISVPSLMRLLKEVLENAVLFNYPKSSEIIVKSRLISEGGDPGIQISIVNHSEKVQKEDLKNFFNPFYTTLGNVVIPDSGEENSPEDYNLRKTHHYGIGLPVARWLSCRLGGEITMNVKQDKVISMLTLPLNNISDSPLPIGERKKERGST